MSYLSKKVEENLLNVLEWTKQTKAVNDLICEDEKALDMFATMEVDLIRLKQARERDNARTWALIKEHRKTDKNYCRPHK